MNFKSKKKAPKGFTAKFYFPESDGKSGVELRFISDEMRQAAYKDLVVEEVDFAIHPNTGRLTKVVTQNFKNTDLEDWSIDTMIAGWWGISLDGEKLECTRENKIKLFRDGEKDEGGSPFASFITENYAALVKSATESFGSTSEIKN